MGSEFFYKCITCNERSDYDQAHYDPQELVGLWKVRRALVALYNADIPMRVHDGICVNGYAGFFYQHGEHECEIISDGWSTKLVNGSGSEPASKPIFLRQLVSADGLKSGFVACEPDVPRTVDTVLAPKLRNDVHELMGGIGRPFESRRYQYVKDVPALVRIYEEKVS